MQPPFLVSYVTTYIYMGVSTLFSAEKIYFYSFHSIRKLPFLKIHIQNTFLRNIKQHFTVNVVIQDTIAGTIMNIEQTFYWIYLIA